MEKIKKINLIFMLTLILSIGFLTKTYAEVNCITSMEVSSSEVKQGEEFKVTIGVSNIQGENGVLIFGGRIEYDKNSLTLIGRNGEDDWSLSYNKENGKFVADRNDGFAKANEKVFTLTFKVNENAKGNTTIVVNNAAVSDAEEEKPIGGSSKTVTIKAKDTNNANGGNNQSGNGNQGGSSNSNQGGNSNQGNKPSNSNNNKPSNPSQGSTTNVNNGNSTNSQENDNSGNNNGTVSGIDTNRINEENTVNNTNTVVKKTDYISKEEPVKLYKQEDHSIIIYIACAVGTLAIIGIGIFAKKKLKK